MFAFLARFIYMYNTVCKHMNVLGFGHTACFECLDFLRNMYMNKYIVQCTYTYTYRGWPENFC